jgi:hypothetical protein
MDLENVGKIKISKEKRLEIQALIRKSYEKGIRMQKEWVVEMRNEGYSDSEIDEIICY